MKKRKGLLAKPALRIRHKTHKSPSAITQELQCAHCRTIFPDYLARCPECGSDEWTALVEVNPYARIPMESILKGCAHLLWMLGILAFFLLAWQMDTNNPAIDRLYLFAAFGCLTISILLSTAFFGLSEIMRRVLRMQRRLKAFHEHYNETHPLRHIWRTHKVE